MATPGPSDLSTEIARIIRERRAGLDVAPTQAALAEAIGVSQAFMSSALAGTAVLDIEQLDMLCTALGLDVVTVIREAEAAANNKHEDVPDFTVSGVTETANLAASRSKKKADIPAAE